MQEVVAWLSPPSRMWYDDKNLDNVLDVYVVYVIF